MSLLSEILPLLFAVMQHVKSYGNICMLSKAPYRYLTKMY